MSIDGVGGVNTLSIVVVQSGLGSDILNDARSIGVQGGTIVLGRGTVRGHLLRLFALDEAPKEIVLMVTPGELAADLHRLLVSKYDVEKPNHGIIISLPVGQVLGLDLSVQRASVKTPTGGGKVGYKTIFTIVERGFGEEVVDIAEEAGSNGATIINARGSGTHEKSKFFGMNIEPEKEIVMIIIDEAGAEAVMRAIETKMGLNQPGKGVLLAMDVTRVSGLYKPGS